MVLKRELNLFFAVMSGVGIILGAGIYVLIGQAAGIGGNAVWMSFLFSAVLAGLTGLSYAELSSMYSKDQGEYQYAKKSFGRYIAFLVAFLIIFEGVISSAAVALGFGGYFSSLIGGSAITVGLILVIICSYISFYGIKESAMANVIATIIETGGLLLIVALAWNKIGSVDYFVMPNGVYGVFEASALIFFAFVGFEAIIKLSEETKNPTVTIPKALLWSIAISTIIYVLVAIAAVSILPWEELASSSSPLADVAAAVLGSKAFILLSVIALFSTGNTVLIILVTTSRMMYGIGSEIKFLNRLHTVGSVHHTPWLAIVITMILTLLFVFLGDIALVASTSNFTIFSTFIIVNASLIVLRKTQPNRKRPFKVPGQLYGIPLLPVIGILASVVMLFFLDRLAIIGGFLLLGCATIMYFLICRLQKKTCDVCAKG